MNLSEIRDLDFNDLGSASTGAKVFLCVFIAVVILVVGYFFKVKDQREELDNKARREAQLMQEFETKQQKAANLEAYEEQLAEMQELLQAMLRQLPSKTEMPELLVDISQTALAAGIDTELFEPGPEAIRDFYAEKPINIRMVGSYHQFGSFVSGVASLPRVVILTMSDISLQPADERRAGGGSGRLVLEGVVTTYRYLEEDEATPIQGGSTAAGGQ